MAEGLLARLKPSSAATRWQLAKAVNRFVFDWITEKDYSVGFASALEVARRRLSSRLRLHARQHWRTIVHGYCQCFE